MHTLIAVNVEPDLTLAKWVFDRPVQPMVLFEDRVMSQRAKKMSDKFAALEVHVYRWKLNWRGSSSENDNVFLRFIVSKKLPRECSDVAK